MKLDSTSFSVWLNPIYFCIIDLHQWRTDNWITPRMKVSLLLRATHLFEEKISMQSSEACPRDGKMFLTENDSLVLQVILWKWFWNPHTLAVWNGVQLPGTIPVVNQSKNIITCNVNTNSTCYKPSHSLEEDITVNTTKQ